MSIASTDSFMYRPHARTKSIFLRFLWKEYRMLRGFWLAVAVLGVLMQMAFAQLMFKSDGIPFTMLLIAWVAAALYAVGAAVTLFSAESEEHTRGYLLNLPGRWLPMFIGKVTLAVVSAFCLGLTLYAVSGIVNGGIWADAVKFRLTFAIAGIAILEATAWGLLFSLWMKQPLLAAVAASVATSFGMQLAIAAAPSADIVLNFSSYREAVPMRLLLSLVVFAVDIWLGKRWFQVAPRPVGWRKKRETEQDIAAVKAATERVRSQGRRRVMVRLLWQTCRESWKTMLVAIPIALLLMASVIIPLSVLNNFQGHYVDVPTPLIVTLFLPALFGAFVFRTDQRGDRRQFLVTHAVPPRYVWLARHLFWGTGMLAITVLVSIAPWLLAALKMNDKILSNVDSSGLGHYLSDTSKFATDWYLFWFQAPRITYLCWTSIFTAYALGQFFSLLLRREILAGLLALLMSIVLVVWATVAGLWMLSPWTFVLPIGLGAMLATWLRMPHWAVGNNRPRSWVLPITAVVAPIVLVIGILPETRLEQLHGASVRHASKNTLQEREAKRTAGKETADAYMQLYASLREIRDPDGINSNQIILTRQMSPYKTKNNPDRQAIVEQLIELTKRPDCRFSNVQIERNLRLAFDQLFASDTIRLEEEGDLDAALERYLAWFRLKNHVIQGQSTAVIQQALMSYHVSGIGEFRAADKVLLQWAMHPDQTSAQIRKAIHGLEQCPEIIADLSEAILADCDQIRDVVLGDEQPSFFDRGSFGWTDFLAYLANQLPWEKQRALQALDIRTDQILFYAWATDESSGNNADARCQLLGDWRKTHPPLPLRLVYRWGQEAFNRELWLAIQANSSYLVMKELYNRIYVNRFLLLNMETQTRRRGLILQLALLAYRLDHQRYPKSLAELSPEYLDHLPLDPFSDETLQYRPQGFDLPFLPDRDAKNAQVAAHTTLLWSVGVTNRQPSEVLLNTGKSNNDRYRVSEEGYNEVIWLAPTETTNRWQRIPIVFTLPKIEPVKDTAVDDRQEGAVAEEKVEEKAEQTEELEEAEEAE